MVQDSPFRKVKVAAVANFIFHLHDGADWTKVWHPGRKFGASGVNLSKEPVKPHEAETDDKIGYWSQSCLKDGE